MSVELVTIRNAQGVPLDGLLWLPDTEPRALIVHLHAKGGNFYTGPGRWIPERSRHLPLAHLTVNMRCHDLGTTRADLECGDLFAAAPDFGRGASVDGGMWERIADGQHDVRAAVQAARERCFETVMLAGHSSGGFYTAEYAALDPSVAGQVLLSPLTGNATALPQWFPEPGAAEAALEHARELVARGRGRQLIPLAHWYYAISAESLLERASEPPGLFEEWLARSEAPTLMLHGDREARGPLWRRLIEGLPRGRGELVTIAGAEHHYVGCEQAVTDAVTRFVLAHA